MKNIIIKIKLIKKYIKNHIIEAFFYIIYNTTRAKSRTCFERQLNYLRFLCKYEYDLDSTASSCSRHLHSLYRLFLANDRGIQYDSSVCSW